MTKRTETTHAPTYPVARAITAITSQQRFHLPVPKNCGSGSDLLPGPSPCVEITCHTLMVQQLKLAHVKSDGESESAFVFVHATCTGPAEYIIMISWTSVQDAHVCSIVCQAS